VSALITAGKRGDAVKYFMRMVRVPAFVIFMMQLMPNVWSKLKAVAHTLPYDMAVMGDFTVPAARIASIRVPTLVMDGEKTQKRLQNAVDEIARVLPSAKRRTLKGQTHNVSAEVLTPELVQFFAA
jgi:pimeloyl-ACP methyl ester carboxylesterase